LTALILSRGLLAMTYRELRIALEKISEGEFAEFVKAFCGSYKSPSNEFAHKPKLAALGSPGQRTT